MKTVLFSPGYMENIDSRNYRATIRAIENRGYRVEFVPIVWKYRTIDDWVRQLEDIYAQHNPKQTILAGFSYGSMTSFVAAAHRNPSELWLFSLSPYFAEDIARPAFKQSWLRSIGVRRSEAFECTEFRALAAAINCPVTLFLGDKEIKRYETMEHRSYDAAAQLKKSRLIIVKGAHHDVGLPSYVKSIEANV